jgi:hypothetical protein
MTHYVEHFGAFLRGHGIEHFTALELCPEGKAHMGVKLRAPTCDLWPNIIPTLRVVEWLREQLNNDAPPSEQRKVIVNSGYRDRAYNHAIGSADTSQHVQFRALDIRVPGVTPVVVKAILESHPDAHSLGIGLYSGFVHVDSRGVKARW